MIDRYIALTESSKKIFQGSYLQLKPERIVVKSNFTEPSKQPKELRRESHFLYVGRLSEEKGILTLLEAFKGSCFQLRIIGEGPLQQTVESVAQKFDNVTYLGYQNKDVIEAELSACTALLFPSVCFETFGMAIIESFETGTPVIGSDLGSPTDLIVEGYNGLHVHAGSAEDLRAKMKCWQDMDMPRKETFYTNALKSYSDHYTPEKNHTQLLNIYRSLVHEKAEH